VDRWDFLFHAKAHKEQRGKANFLLRLLIFATLRETNHILQSKLFFESEALLNSPVSLFLRPRSRRTMDSIRVSEAPDPGSIPGETTDARLLSEVGLFYA
jgi:hypothetical protein